MSRSNQLLPLEELEARTGTQIHPTSIVAPGAKIGNRTVIGPFCIIGAGVVIGDGCTLKSNVCIEGEVEIGQGSFIHEFCVIGNHSHDLKFNAKERTKIVIGKECVIREFTNIHAGTPNSGGTIIGDNVYIMSHSHIGHDCEVRDGALLSQQTTLGGEVVIQERAIIGGCTAIHQFCTIGKYAIIGGCSKVTMDVIPYSMSDGNPQRLAGLNLVGLKRNGFSVDDIRTIKEVYKILFLSDEGLWEERLATAKSVYDSNPVAHEIFRFIAEDSRRIIAKPVKGKPVEGEA